MPPPKSTPNDRSAFESSIRALEAELASIGAHLAIDSGARLQYTRQIKEMEGKGMVVARPDLKPWRAAMTPAWDKVKVRVGADNFKKFMDMVNRASK